MKLISFAVPCYNSAEYMDKCINSLLKGGEDVEIIIVDDGSTKDDTYKIAKGYEEKYPTVVRAIHQENGGHGQAVNTGIANATGKYFKVVDSDDWVDEKALNELIETIKGFKEEPDAILMNYVYEHTVDNTEKVVDYKKEFPENVIFGFEESKGFETGKFIAMHSVVYKTQLLLDIKLELPKHTFYVDNIFVYYPLPYIKTFYYLNVDFYRYFIGREDQSVNEKIIMNRIDQHIRVTEILLKSHDLNKIKESSPKLYKYMLDFIAIMMTINSIYLIKKGGKDSKEKKKKLWALLKETDIKTYKKCKHRFTGIVSSNCFIVTGFCKIVYVIARKIFKFN